MKSTTKGDSKDRANALSSGKQSNRASMSGSRAAENKGQQRRTSGAGTSMDGADSGAQTSVGGSTRVKGGAKAAASNVADAHQPASTRSAKTMERRHQSLSSSLAAQGVHQQQHHAATTASSSKQAPCKRRQQLFKETSRQDQSEDTSSSSQEMTTTTTSASSMRSDVTLTPMEGGNIVLEQETNLMSGCDSNRGADDNTDEDECTTLLESPKLVGGSRRTKASINFDLTATKSRGANSHGPEIVHYHDEEEIDSAMLAAAQARVQPTSTTDEDEYEEDDLYELSNGAALTMADDDQLTTLHSEEISFVVYPLGCCEFDETQLVSSTSTRAIQKCILRLSNKPSPEEATCWGLGQSQPILMRLLEDHIQFTDIASQTLLRSVPIQTIKSWAVDDDNNFAFVIEESQQAADDRAAANALAPDYALLHGPVLLCYVLRSLDDDDMSCRIAAKLHEEITRHRAQLSSRVSGSTRLQQMIVVDPRPNKPATSQLGQIQDQTTDLEADDLDELDQLDSGQELSMAVKYIGKVQVSRPMGIDVLNIAIDKCLAEASDRSISSGSKEQACSSTCESPPRSSGADSPLVEARLHVSPSSVIVENVETGSIIVECRIRFLTFMGISRRDIRWCGFIMQNTTNKTFVAHCFQCHPTAGHVCEAIQASCSRMYERMLRGQRSKQRQQQDSSSSIIPNGSKIRDTLAKTLSRIKLTPII